MAKYILPSQEATNTLSLFAFVMLLLILLSLLYNAIKGDGGNPWMLP